MKLSSIIKSNVFSQREERAIALIHGAIFDPENGKLVAISVTKDFRKIIAANDILKLSPAGAAIHTKDAIIALQEVLRAQQIIQEGVRFLGNRAYTQKEVYIGKVVDLELHQRDFIIDKLIIAKTLLGFRFHERSIPRKEIIRVEHDRVIVRDSSHIKKAKDASLVSAPV